MPPIDTLKASKRLQEEGTFSPEQAERIAEILSDLDVASATKEDLDEVEERLGARIDQVEERLGARIGQLEARIDQVEERLDARIDSLETRMDERFNQVDERFDEVEARLTQRVELSEQRTEKQISHLRTDLYRGLFIGVGAVAALVTVLGYLLG
jgi:tetrahydromethanopterin S-methyltransferase subunit G